MEGGAHFFSRRGAVKYSTSAIDLHLNFHPSVIRVAADLRAASIATVRDTTRICFGAATMIRISIICLLLALPTMLSAASSGSSYSRYAGEKEAPATKLAFIGDASINHPSPHISLAQFSATLSPSTVETGSSPTLTISVSGFLDLSEVQLPQISIQPSQGIANMRIASATAQRMLLVFDLSKSASPGNRILRIKDASGATRISLDLTVKLAPDVCRPECQPPKRCVNNQCVLPSDICIPACGPFQRCRNNVCVHDPDICEPPCGPGLVCNENHCQSECLPGDCPIGQHCGSHGCVPN